MEKTSTVTQKAIKLLDVPSEVLHDIFKDVLNVNNYSRIRDIQTNRRQIMLTCKMFHDIIIESPTLWSFITLSGPQPNFDAAGKMVELSREAPLHLHLDLRTEDSPDWCGPEMIKRLFGGFILPRMAQTERLIFIVDNSDIVDAIYSSLSSTSAPNLKEFKLVFGTLDLGNGEHLTIRDQPSTIDEAHSLFNNHYPLLRKLTIHYAPLEFASFNMDTITHLDLSHQQAIHPALFFGMISATPLLQSLILRGSGPAFECRNGSSPMVPLPHLRRLVLGSMESTYLSYLLSIFRSLDVREFGIHTVSESNAEAIWTSLLAYHRLTNCFAKLEKLELFDVEDSSEMMEGKSNSYQDLISSLTHLRHIRMRRITARHLSILNSNDYSPPTSIFSLQVLEISSVIESLNESGGSDSRDREPLRMKEVVSLITSLFKSRAQRDEHGKEHEWKVRRLHLDEDEWNSNEGEKKKLLGNLMQLGPIAPIVAWDARAPFFNDYYDSEEI